MFYALRHRVVERRSSDLRADRHYRPLRQFPRVNRAIDVRFSKDLAHPPFWPDDAVTPMAQRSFTALRDLFPSLSAQLTRDSASAALAPAWREAVGEGIAQHTRLLGLEGTTLVVWAATPRWRGELATLEPQLLARLARSLGAGRVLRIRVQAEPAPR